MEFRPVGEPLLNPKTASQPTRRTIGLITAGELYGFGLCRALSLVWDCDVCAEGIGVVDAEADVMIVDLFDDAATLAEVRRFRACHPRIPLIGIFSEPAAASRIGQLPAFAPLRRSAPIDEFIAVVAALQPAIPTIESGNGTGEKLDALSPREMELLPLLAAGQTLQAAARKLGITYKTADSYRSNLLRKLGIRDRIQLARFAIRAGIIDA